MSAGEIRGVVTARVGERTVDIHDTVKCCETLNPKRKKVSNSNIMLIVIFKSKTSSHKQQQIWRIKAKTKEV